MLRTATCPSSLKSAASALIKTFESPYRNDPENCGEQAGETVENPPPPAPLSSLEPVMGKWWPAVLLLTLAVLASADCPPQAPCYTEAGIVNGASFVAGSLAPNT